MLSTNEKIKFLQLHVKKWHERWHKKHSDNIIGFRIGKKKTNNTECRNYSIIFQVKEKKEISLLSEKEIIPTQFKIKFPDGVFRHIKTDVEEAITLKLQRGITSEVNSIYSKGSFGTAGLFVTDRLNKLFMLTNYHVIADQMIRNGQYYYRRQPEFIKNDVKILTTSTTNMIGRFEEGILSHEVDAAFVQLFMPPDENMNILPDQNRVRGRVTVRPYPPYYRNKPVVVYSFFNKLGRKAIISDNSSILYTENPNIYFNDLLEISPKITKGGDSGGIVLTPAFSVLGLVVGGREDPYGGKTYVIPFYKIDDFKNISII